MHYMANFQIIKQYIHLKLVIGEEMVNECSPTIGH